MTGRLFAAAVWAGVGLSAAAAEPVPKAPHPNAPPAEAAVPDLSPDEKAAVMRVARGLLNALWKGEDPDNVPAAALRDRKHPVTLAVRRNGALLGRSQAAGGDLLESLRETLAGAVTQAKLAAPAGTKPEELRIDLEIAGEPQPIRFRHHVPGPDGRLVPGYELTADSLVALEREQLSRELREKVSRLQGRRFAGDDGFAAELAKVLTPFELGSHKDRILASARLPARVADDVLDACRRGIHGLLVEVPTAKRLYVGRTYPGETITENMTPERFVFLAMSRALLPPHLGGKELRILVDRDGLRFGRFRSLHLVETDALGGYAEPFRGHKPVTDDEVQVRRVASAANGLVTYMVDRQIRFPPLTYYPSVDTSETAPLPMDYAAVAWGLAEAAARFPDNAPLTLLAIRILQGLGNAVQEIQVAASPAENFLAESAGKPTVSVPKTPAERRFLTVFGLMEPDGQTAHLGAAATAAIAMSRLPAGKARDHLTGKPYDLKVEGRTVKMPKPRERLLHGIVWMQNRERVVGPAPVVRSDNLVVGDRVRDEIGSFRTYFPPARQALGQDLYGGPALQAMAWSYTPGEPGHPVVLKALQDARRFYLDQFRHAPQWKTVAWQIPGFATASEKIPGDVEMAAAALEMADGLLRKQRTAATATDSDLIGSFPPEGGSAPLRVTAMTALSVTALCAAHKTAVRLGEKDRAARYLTGVKAGVRYLLAQQYADEDLYYVARPDLTRNGIRSEPGDNTIHLPTCAFTLIALLRAQETLWPVAE
jgi:hypothetical protein